jgi:hypothetical protein
MVPAAALARARPAATAKAVVNAPDAVPMSEGATLRSQCVRTIGHTNQ